MPLHRTASVARVSSTLSGSPTAVARPRIVRSENSAPPSTTDSVTREPRPVVTPYTGVPERAARSTTSLAAAIRAAASSAIRTSAPSRAMPGPGPASARFR